MKQLIDHCFLAYFEDKFSSIGRLLLAEEQVQKYFVDDEEG